jgi:hypothetical protein
MERRIALPKGDYYELKARLLEVELAQSRVDAARQRLGAVFVPLSTAHGFDPAWPLRLDDATCELVGADTTDGAGHDALLAYAPDATRARTTV